MRAEATLRLGARKVLGEVTTEIEGARGRPFFVPWRTVRQFIRDRPLALEQLPPRAEMLVADPRQLSRVATLTAACGVGAVVDPGRPARGLLNPRSVTFQIEATDYESICRLLLSDGQSFAAWARTALRRELYRRHANDDLVEK